jgi:hypothetical protein
VGVATLQAVFSVLLALVQETLQAVIAHLLGQENVIIQ